MSQINSSKELTIFSNEMKSLGNSQMDMYIGKLTVQTIYQEIIASLPYLERTKFKVWLDESGGFHEIAISDGSTWIILHSEKEQFIHLHPARYSNHSIRINATILKTAALATCAMKLGSVNTFNTQSINFLRTTILNLSPIKSFERSEQLKRVIQLLNT